MLDNLGCCFRQRTPATAEMTQCQRTIAVALETNDLHVRNADFLRVLLPELQKNLVTPAS